MTSEPSGRLYSLVTKHWPRIAAGLVVLSGLVEFVVGGLTADSGVEFYLMAWAGTTGGLWFLFETAETAISEESREKVVGWARSDLGLSIETIPHRFSILFDQVFGVRHLSLKCFSRSALASVASALVVLLVFGSLVLGRIPERVIELGEPGFGKALFLVAAANIVLDYLSLLETRTAIRWAVGVDHGGEWVRQVVGSMEFTPGWVDLVSNARGSQRVVTALLADLAFTLFGSGLFWGAILSQGGLRVGEAMLSTVVVVGILSSLFTSVWLWLYAGSVLVSRGLLRMNSGVGFLLRVTDVERQPFRSMGFVSVIIVSVLFALGLPLMLL